MLSFLWVQLLLYPAVLIKTCFLESSPVKDRSVLLICINLKSNKIFGFLELSPILISRMNCSTQVICFRHLTLFILGGGAHCAPLQVFFPAVPKPVYSRLMKLSDF